MWQTWLILSGIFLVIEIINVSFLVFWFSIGALLAMVVSFFTNNIFIQATVFLISSTLLLFITKPLVNKILPKDSLVKTNSASPEGKEGIVTQEINNSESTGQIKIESETWTARSDDETTIPVGSKVKVIKVDGVKAIVNKI